jgi:hypothetical protein
MTTRSIFDNYYMSPITPESLRATEVIVLPRALEGDYSNCQ